MTPGIRLIPYPNQVTGHDCLLTTEDNLAICKVKDTDELDFYLKMDKSLQPFTPQFLGTVDVTVSVDEFGRHTFEGNFENGSRPFLNRRSSGRRKKSERMPAQWDKVKYRTLDLEKMSDEPEFQSNHYTHDRKHWMTTTLCLVGQNPWVERVERVGRHTHHTGDTIPYIVLENVSRHFEKPCILDLKVGTQRTRGCSEAKIRRQLVKNQLTTTAALGIRLSGLQVYQEGTFTCRDKFYGRGLSNRGLQDSVKLFFSDGEEMRMKALENTMDKASKIKEILLGLKGYRFHGSSLVVFYEGSDATRMSPNVDVRLVDFAHSSRATPECSGADEVFIRGISSFISIMENIKAATIV